MLKYASQTQKQQLCKAHNSQKGKYNQTNFVFIIFMEKSHFTIKSI